MKPTNSVTLPATTALSKAGAVHHVALLVLFGERLVHLVGETVHNALVCNRHRYIKTWLNKNGTPLLCFEALCSVLCANLNDVCVCFHVLQVQMKPHKVQVCRLRTDPYVGEGLYDI